MGEVAYFKKLECQDEAYEALCKRCGTCCGGSTGDPCVNLTRRADNSYYCAIYETRHGIQRSIFGGMFTCVNIRDVISSGVEYPGCPYCQK